MKSTIVTIFPRPSERDAAARPALVGTSSSQPAPGMPAAIDPVNTLPSVESVILQRLLAEVEARQVTRAQPTYVIEPSPPRRITLVRVLWGSLWALSIAVSVLTVKYIDSQTITPRADDAQSRSIEKLNASIVSQNQAFSTFIDSLQQLAGTLASNARSTVDLPKILDLLDNGLHETRSAPGPPPSPPVAQSSMPATQPSMPIIIGTSSPRNDSAPIPMGGHIHPPIEFAVAPADVIVHHNSAGVMDYWLVPRVTSGVQIMKKVVPVLQTNAGIFVHDIAEVKDYTITPSGDWIEAEPNGNK